MSDPSVSRRAFFTSGLFKVVGRAVNALGNGVVTRQYVRPPGALPEAAFLAACTRCGDCITVCPVAAITRVGSDHGLASGTPLLQPALDACVMCADMPCAGACPTGALEVPPDGWARVHFASVAIDDRCITNRDVECGVCARVCPAGPDAIHIDTDGHPRIGAACTGCGICVAACVTEPSSIHLT